MLERKMGETAEVVGGLFFFISCRCFVDATEEDIMFVVADDVSVLHV